MILLRFFPFFVLLACVVCAPSQAAARPLPATPPARPLITQGIDPTVTTELPGNTRAEALVPGNDRGAVPDDFPLPDLLLQLERPPEREAALAAFLDAQQDPASPDYHNWLGAADFGALFGPAPQDIDTVAAWLQAQGFVVDRVYDSGMTIAFSGTAGLVRKAFATEIHYLDVGGRAHFANVRNPRIPQALAAAVHGVVALHDFKPRPQLQPLVLPDYTISSSTHAIVPADLATIYNLSPLFAAGIKGNGLTIALIEDTDVYATSDIGTFRSVFGLGTASFSQTHPGCSDPGVVTGDDAEAELDVEWAAAAAPGATLQLVSCANLFDAIANLVNANATPPAIMSISYGACEADLGASANSFVSSTYQQAAAKGIAVFVSSGDEGAAGCDNNATAATKGIAVNGLASTAYNVAVGGTDFGDTYAGTTATYWNSTNTATYGSAKSYINEIPWNDSCASQLLATRKGFATTYGSSGFCNSASGANYLTTAAGSGGPSATWGKPTWQSGLVGNPGDSRRDLPDVSLFAANGLWGHYFVYCFTDPNAGGKSCGGAPSGWAGAGGTSFSAPILAGIQALVQQKAGIALAGNPNPTYYALAAGEYGAGGSTTCNSSNGNAVGSACIFYDVTQGDMDVNCASGSPNCYRPSGTNGVLSTSSGSYLPAYKTATGWDFATGIGSVNAANLAASWPSSGAKHLKFTVEPVSSTAGATLAAVKVAIENASASVVTTDTSAVTLKLANNPGGATLGGTLTVNAVSGVATFGNLTLNKSGTGYTLAASDGSLAGDTSTAFNITAAAAKKLVFTTQPPASVTSGASFGAAITIEDTYGNTVTNNTSSVTVALTTANGATLSGTKTHAASGGVATFSGLSINKAGSYTLTATDGTLTAATSTSLAVAPGAAAQLKFTTQPVSVSAGASLSVAVAIEDAAGNVETADNATQIVLKVNECNNATLATTTVVGGVAQFGDLRFYTPKSSVQLSAQSSGNLSAASSTFSVLANPDLLFTGAFDTCVP